jgi:hypothetical protein
MVPVVAVGVVLGVLVVSFDLELVFGVMPENGEMPGGWRWFSPAGAGAAWWCSSSLWCSSGWSRRWRGGLLLATP